MIVTIQVACSEIQNFEIFKALGADSLANSAAAHTALLPVAHAGYSTPAAVIKTPIKPSYVATSKTFRLNHLTRHSNSPRLIRYGVRKPDKRALQTSMRSSGFHD